MKYYCIEYAYDLETIGCNYPQLTINGGKISNPDNSASCLNKKNYKDFTLDTRSIFLNKNAIPTDILSQMFCPNGLVISGRLFDMLSRFSLPNHRIFEIPIMRKGVKLNYYLLFLSIDLFEYTKWPLSTFEIRNGLDRKKEIILSDKNEYENLKLRVNEYYKKKKEFADTTGMPRPGFFRENLKLEEESITAFYTKRLVLADSITQFAIINDFSNFYFSENCKNEMEKLGFTGGHLINRRRLSIHEK